MYQRTLLPNGLRLVTSKMSHTHSVTVGFFIGAGSRYETDAQAGGSHFIEHLCFKGAERRRSAKEISEAIEGVGGILNGGTDRELTVYWCKVARPHFPLALDVLVDMLRHSTFNPEEIEKERKVILEEINMMLDSPPQLVDALIDEVVWPNQPLGRDVAGTKESVSALTRNDLLDYMGHQYVPNNLVVSVAGNISHHEVKEAIGAALGDWTEHPTGKWYPAEDEQDTPRLRLISKKTEQVHLCLAFRGLSNLHPDRFVLDILNVILGEGMSSRLFLELREKRGLAYDVHSYVSHFRDSGSTTIYAGVDPGNTKATIQALLDELKRLREDIPAAEVTKAKELSKGRLLLRMEDTRSVASWMGAQELLTGRILTVDEVVNIVDSITVEDLLRVAGQLLVTGKLNLALVGPLRSEKQYQSLLKL